MWNHLNKKEIKDKKNKDELLTKAIEAVQAVDSENILKKTKNLNYYGYIRVSTEEQDLSRQEIALANYATKEGIEFKRIFKEKASAISLNRPELENLRNRLDPNDVVVVESYDRLCRSTLDLLTLIDQFEAQGVGFVSIKENFDTTNAMGRLMLTVVAAVGEAERKLMLERQRNGIRKAQAEGKYKGRQPIKKPDSFDFYLDKYLHATKLNPYPFRKFLEDTNLKRSTLIRFIQKSKINSVETLNQKN